MVDQPTIDQVAILAGVSLGSASRALNHNGASPAMIERVERAARELGYRPSALGRSLRTKKTFQIAFAVADIGNPIYVEMLDSAHKVLAPHGYRMVVLSTGESLHTTLELIRDLDSGFVDGLIIIPLRSSPELTEALQQSAVPVAVLGMVGFGNGIDTVSVDSAAGIELAVDSLIEQGARRFLFLNGPVDTTPGGARRRGMEAAAARNFNVIESLSLIEATDFTAEAAAAALGEMLASNPRALHQIDALVAANDLMAVGAIRLIKHQGLAVPDDILVTGMDDTELARLYDPSLTSVSTRAAERARKAARLLLGNLNHNHDDGGTTIVQPELIVRESSVRPSSAHKH